MSMLTHIHVIGVIVIGQKGIMRLPRLDVAERGFWSVFSLFTQKKNLLKTDKIHSVIIWTRHFY